ncbi:hypothetical protein AGOR_G00220450 [Albula goreensis]|uniref:Fibronectin type-III domain-containing protein n=1 Tax=Albula goreensis TaxID=1534307 RepID=A0A8T3CPK7_9TELE|nr:hypothetical protein AGOR_G00220450 [Albula goreensis]
MEVVFRAALLALLFLVNVFKVSAWLPHPHNVSLQTLNTQYILTWAWDQNQNQTQGCTGNQTVMFTAQYLPKFKLKRKKRDWRSVCQSTEDWQCDFTGCDLHYLGVYVLRVRATCAEQRSQWVQLEFCPDKQAHLGPPSRVEVISGPELLEVRVSDPLTSRNASMKDFYPDLYYLIQYWKHAQDEVRGIRSLNTSTNIVTLSRLDRWTQYCVRVQSRYNYYSKISSFSQPICQQTTGSTPAWQIALLFLASLVVCFVCVLLPSYGLLKFYRLIKLNFFPKCQLPAYLNDSSPGSDRPRLLSVESQVEVCCDEIDVCPVVTLPEIHAADIAVETDPSGHSRQGSGDSGMYSNGEGSAQLGTTVTERGQGRGQSR